jgi:hypothetical protein
MGTITHEREQDLETVHDDSPWPAAPEETHEERSAFREALARLAAKAKAALPESNGRVEKAEALVLNHDIAYDAASGTALVGSGTEAQATYRVRGKVCECPDYDRAPNHLCKHVLGVMFLIRLEQELGMAPQAAPDPEPAPVPAPELGPAATEPVQGIDPKFIVWIANRPFVRHAGLLKRAHECGLQSLTVNWTYNDAELSLAHAVAIFADGRRFEESGDSAPGNVGKKVALHWRRIALTRASARALRLSLGCELVAVEELAESD